MNITKTKSDSVAKKIKSREDIYYPVPQDFSPIRVEKPQSNQDVIRRIIQGSIKTAYGLKDPELYDWHGKAVRAKAMATHDQVEMVMHLIESLQPSDAIEAALASQFAITYVRAMEEKNLRGEATINLELFEFGHKVLETLQKYRCKGAQQISVQYNVNQGQVVNIKNVKKDEQPITLEGTGK